MKFNCGKAEDKNLNHKDRLKKWHSHFAWWPVTVGDYDCRWLEFVERRYPGAWIGPISKNLYKEEPEYRAIKSS